MATHSTWWVIGNRSNARSDVSAYPCSAKVATSRASAAGSQATYATARGPRAAIPSTTSLRAPVRGGSSTTRSRGPTRSPASARSTRSASSRDLVQVGEVLLRVVDGGLVGLDGDDVAGRPDPLGQGGGEQPDPGVEVGGPLPRLRVESLEHGGHQGVRGGRVHLPEAGAGDLERPAGRLLVQHGRPVGEGAVVPGGDERQRLAGRRHERLHTGGALHLRRGGRGVGDGGVRDPAAVDRHHVVGPVLAQADGPVAAERPLHPGPPAQARARALPAPTSSTVTSTSSPASRRSCSATTAALRPRWAGSDACWKSQPPQRPGPANGQGGVTRSGEASSTSTASARRNRSPSRPSVTSATTRSPGSACRTKTTTPSCRATTKPP